MLPGFLPQSTPPAPPAGGALPAAPGADAVTPTDEGEAFTSALDSACDAPSRCADTARSNSAERPVPGTSQRLAAWLALARGANPVADAVANEDATQQAPPFSDDGVELPVIGDREEAEEAAVAEAGGAGDAADAVIAPIIASAVVAEMPFPQAAAGTSPDVPVAESSDDSVTAVARGSSEAAEAAQAPGWHSASGAASRNGRPASDRTAQADRSESNGRSQQALPVNGAGTKAEGISPAGEPINGADVSAPEASADVRHAQSEAPSSNPLQTADVRGVASHPPASAGSNAARVSSALQGAATQTTTATQQGAIANSAGNQTAQADATVAVAAEAGDVRAVTKPVSASADDTSQESSHRSVSSATAAQGASPGGDLQGGSSQGSQSGGSERGASPHDVFRESQDVEAAGRSRGLDVAVTRSAAAALLTLVAGPDGALRLTPAAMAAPVLPPLLQQDHTANIEQLVQTMRVMVKDQVTEATVHLRPQHFGEVSIQVRMDGKSVSAIIHTESSQVRDWMLGQEGTLRNGLSEQGLHLDRLVVQRDGRQDRRDHTQQQPERRRQRQRQQSDPQQTFELSA